jgi:hypothetical protein
MPEAGWRVKEIETKAHEDRRTKEPRLADRALGFSDWCGEVGRNAMKEYVRGLVLMLSLGLVASTPVLAGSPVRRWGWRSAIRGGSKRAAYRQGNRILRVFIRDRLPRCAACAF